MRALAQPQRLGAIVDALGGELRGDPELQITRLAPLESADGASLSFLANPHYRQQLLESGAGCVILSPAMAQGHAGSVIVTDDPYLYFARLTQWWARLLRPEAQSGIAPGAHIDASAHIDPTATVEAGAVIGAHASVAAHAVIGALSYVGAQASVGEGSRLAPRVTLMHDCRIGRRAILHSGVVIGADGFGFAPQHGQWVKIEQLGAVHIGDDVEIGANTCIDRGALDDTVISDGVKIDNLVQIGHNVHIGEGTAIAGCVGIAGSTHIGRRCQIGGASGLAGHITIADDVIILGGTSVSKSISKPGLYSGVVPFEEARAWRKNIVLLRHLSDMLARLRAIENKISPD